MGLTESLKQFYEGIEESYYNLCDYLQQNLHFPIYDWFVTPIETRGIPSFPFFLALIVLIIGGGIFAYYALSGGATSVKVSVEVAGTPAPNIPVSLYIDGKLFKTVKSSKSGIALFEGVPLDRQARILIDEEGFEPFEQSFKTGKATPEIIASLQSSGGGGGKNNIRITLKITDEIGIPLGGASASYFDSESGNYDSQITDASGTAILIAENSNSELSLTVSKSGYQTATSTIIVALEKSKTIALKKKADIDDGDIDPDISKGEVLVTVKDEEGNFVDAVVSLLYASTDAVIDVGRTYDSGKAQFQDVDAVGSKVYIVATPRDESLLLPYDGSDDARTLTSKTPLEFIVQLSSKEPGEDYNITLIVKEKDGEALQDALVKWYNQESNARLFSAYTDYDGVATFSSDKQTYATVYMEEYLPSLQLDLYAGEPRHVELEKINTDNSAKVKAIVLDYDGNLVQGAKINIFTDDGFFAGLPEETSKEDGTALFIGIPLERGEGQASYMLRANSHGVSGTSAIFSLEVGEEKEVVIRLDEPKGIAIIKLKDATNQKPAGVSGNVATFLRDTETQIPDAVCGLLNGTCEIIIPANKQVYFKISANGYLPLETEDFSVEFEETKTLEASVIPAALRNELFASFDGLADASDGSATYSTALETVTRGAFYLAKFTLNIPQGTDKGGIFVKVSGNDGASADEDFAAISGYEKPGNAQITKGFSFKPSSDCSSDVASENDASDKLAKWLNYEYRNQQGSKAVVIKVFVKPQARNQDMVFVDFRAYAAAGSIYSRMPDDPDLNAEEKIQEKDSCYATTNGTSFKVTEDRFSCKNGICMSMLFGTRKVSKGFSSPTGMPFKIQLAGRALENFDSPYFRILDDNEIIFNGYRFAGSDGDAAGEGEQYFYIDSFGKGSSVEGSLDAKGTLPSAYSKIALEFGDANGVLHSIKTTVQITGENAFDMSVTPFELQANEDGRLTIILLNSDDGQPVTDATVSIEEEENDVFEGNTPESIIGNNGENSGRDGRYAFRKIHPLNNGVFRVVAKREGYENAQKTITATMFDYLEASAASLTLTCDGGTIQLDNLLNSKIYVVAKSSCLEILGDGVTAAGNQATFGINAKGSKDLTLNPTKQGTFCDLYFDSQSGSAHANLKIPTKVNCNVLDKVCISDAQCPLGQKCDYDAGGVCKDKIIIISPSPDVSVQPKYCTPNGDECDAGYACVNGICTRIICSQANPCPTGLVCSTNGECTEPVKPECIEDTDCFDEKVCRNNICRVQCTLDEECGDGMQCLLNACFFLGEGYPDLTDPLRIFLDPSTNYHNQSQYSLKNVVANVSPDDCEIRSGDTDSSLRMERFVTVDCDIYRDYRAIDIIADYGDHPYYTDTVNFLANHTVKKISDDWVEIQNGSLIITARGVPTKTIKVKIIGPPATYSQKENTVLITENGFEPSEIRINTNESVTWINMDSKQHGVSSFASADDKLISGNLLFEKKVILPGQSYTFKFDKKIGVYNYRDPSRTAIRGVVIVGDPEAECRYKNLNYFAQRFVGYLAKSTTRFFDPSGGKSEQIAYSSFYKIQVGPSMMQFGGVPGGIAPTGVYGYGMNPYQTQYNINDPRIGNYQQQQWNQFGQYGTLSGATDPGLCTNTGSGFDCKVELSPFLPVNGIAFTIVNDYALYNGAPSQLLINPSGTEDKYLAALYVDHAGADGAIVGGLQKLNEVFLTAPRFATFVLTNDPNKIVYTIDEESGGVKVRFEGTESKTVRQRLIVNFPSTQQAFTITINFVIRDDWNEYALQQVPVEDVVSRSSRTADESKFTLDPFYFVDNVPSSKLESKAS
ncbi:MAG: cupredoxin domain-containing protein, partial [Candidatus Micrarchaeota archaeon]